MIKETWNELEERLVKAAAKEVDFERNYTIKEYYWLQTPDLFDDAELVRGKLVPRSLFWIGKPEALISSQLLFELLRFADDNDLGQVYPPVGVVFDKAAPTVRVPRACFVAKGRELTIEQKLESASYRNDYFLQLIPDLIVDFFLSRDNWIDMKDRVQEYQKSGVRLMWLIDMLQKVTYVFRSNSLEPAILNFDEELNGEEILPDFKVKIAYLSEWKR